MFQIIPTKNYAGFELRGDSGDFRSLLSAIYYLDNEEYLRAAGYHDVMNYFFTLAFEARYALEGRRGFVCTDNGSGVWNLSGGTRPYPEVPEKNLYYAVRIPAIRMLFYAFTADEMIALDRMFREEPGKNDEERAGKEAAEAFLRLLEIMIYHGLDGIIGIRERIALQERLAARRLAEFYLFRNYVTLYTDFLSETYLSLPRLRRKRLLTSMLDDIVCYDKNDTYRLLKKNTRAWAKTHPVPLSSIKYGGGMDRSNMQW